jgi:hypothetical protein
MTLTGSTNLRLLHVSNTLHSYLRHVNLKGKGVVRTFLGAWSSPPGDRHMQLHCSRFHGTHEPTAFRQ